jgi:hypothetical protein
VNKNIIIVSKLLHTSPLEVDPNGPEVYYHFHFKGVFAGDLLQSVKLIGPRLPEMVTGEEYLLYVRMIALEAGTLLGRILKVKPLEECWDSTEGANNG